MAKGKSSSGVSRVSKGERNAVSRRTVNAVKNGRTSGEKLINKVNAWKAGKNPWITVVNPNPEEKNKKLIRVQSNQIWGNPRSGRKEDLIPLEE